MVSKSVANSYLNENVIVTWGSLISLSDVDECRLEGDKRGPCEYECLNTVGSYKCFCPAGSVLSEDGTSCALVTCPKCIHGGYCDQRTSKCVCPAGFTGEICETGEPTRNLMMIIYFNCQTGCRFLHVRYVINL